MISTPKQQKPKVISQPTQPKIVAKAAAPAIKQEPVLKIEDPTGDESVLQVEAAESGTATEQTDWSSFTMADGDNPIYVTGDDGTIYQVAGQNEQV